MLSIMGIQEEECLFFQRRYSIWQNISIRVGMGVFQEEKGSKVFRGERIILRVCIISMVYWNNYEKVLLLNFRVLEGS